MTNTNNSPPGGTPSPKLQQSLIVSPPTNLHARHARGGLHHGAESQQGITPQFVLTAIRQWWKVATPAALVLALIAGGLIDWLTPQKYEASALLRIKEQKPYLVVPQPESWDRFVHTQIQTIAGRNVLGEVFGKKEDGKDKHPEVVSIRELKEKTKWERLRGWEVDPIQRLKDNLQVIDIKGSEYLRVSYRGRNPDDSARIVNAVVNEYLGLDNADTVIKANDHIQKLMDEKKRRLSPNEEIAKTREKVRRLTKEATGKDPFAAFPDPGLPIESPLARMHDSLVNAEANRAVLKAEIKALEESFVWLGSAGTTSGGGSATVRLAGDDNDLVIKPAERDPELEGVNIVFVAQAAMGDQAIVTFDATKGKLTIDIDPGSTTANTVIAEINSQDKFTAELDTTADRSNDGTGRIGDSLLDIRAGTTLASDYASTQIKLPGEHNDLKVTAVEPGPVFDNKHIVFVNDSVTGDQAIAKFDKVGGTLTIDIDPTATTANTVIEAIGAEGTFVATLDKTLLDSTNNGTGLISMKQIEVPYGIVEKVVQEDPEVHRLAALVSAKRSELHEFETKSVKGEDGSFSEKLQNFYEKLQKEATQYEDTLQQVRADLRQQIKAYAQVAEISRREDVLAAMKAQLMGFHIREALLRDRHEKKRKELMEYSGETVDLVFAKTDLAEAEEVVRSLERRIVSLTTEKKAPPRVTLVQLAFPPKAPLSNLTFVVLGPLAGLCLPFALAVLWELIVRRVTDAQQLEKHSNLAVVGEVARLPVRTTVLSKSSSKRVGRSLGIFEESIDTLRTCLVLSEPLKDMKVLAVTSSVNHEGKTSVAVQLAVSIARASGEPTLLIDGDMRSPDIHNVLDVPLQPGLGDILAKQCSLEDAIVTDLSDSVHVLPAGKLHSSPHKLLGNGVLGSLFAEVRSSYRYIVVDTPPVLAASEALVLASSADAALVCAMRDVSRVDQIKRTHERLLAAGAHPVGIVLNGISAKRYTYRYGSYAYSQE